MLPEIDPKIDFEHLVERGPEKRAATVIGRETGPVIVTIEMGEMGVDETDPVIGREREILTDDEETGYFIRN